MNVQELYDYLLTQMSVEQALLKLLEGHALTYEHLKFNEGEEIHPMMLISMAAFEIGWSLAIPEGKDDDEVQGMTVGTEEYLESIFPSNPIDHPDKDKNGCGSSNCQNR